MPAARLALSASPEEPASRTFRLASLAKRPLEAGLKFYLCIFIVFVIIVSHFFHEFKHIF